MMALTLDNLAHRYNCLPSQALANATTLDLYVLDISAKWSKYQQDKVDQGNGFVKPAPKLSVEEMQAMIRNVKERNK